MNQPPDPELPPQWRRPRGVAPGTWEYVNERSIADHYDSFVADTPLCRVDTAILDELLPGVECECPEIVLDLGCGSGRTSLPLAQRGYIVIGVDLSLRMLNMMAEKASRSPVSGRVLPVRTNLVQLDCFAESSADHAICLFSTLGMIQGRQNRREMLTHVARIVRGSGRFLLHVHNRWAAIRETHGIWALAQSWVRSCRDLEHEFGDATYAYRGLEQMFMHRFSRRELLRDLRSSGWHVETVWPLSIDGTHVNRRTRVPGGFIVSCRKQEISD